jgi:hypothetical protein
MTAPRITIQVRFLDADFAQDATEVLRLGYSVSGERYADTVRLSGDVVSVVAFVQACTRGPKGMISRSEADHAVLDAIRQATASSDN